MSVQIKLMSYVKIIYSQSRSDHLPGTLVPLPETQLSLNLCKTNTEKCQMKMPKKKVFFFKQKSSTKILPNEFFVLNINSKFFFTLKEWTWFLGFFFSSCSNTFDFWAITCSKVYIFFKLLFIIKCSLFTLLWFLYKIILYWL